MQTWERHGKAWMMVDETRVRGAEMPGLPEPADPGRRSSEAVDLGRNWPRAPGPTFPRERATSPGTG